MPKKNLRRISITVSSQTLYHLENMRCLCGYKDIGQVIDKLVREKRVSQYDAIQEVRHNASSKSR